VPWGWAGPAAVATPGRPDPRDLDSAGADLMLFDFSEGSPARPLTARTLSRVTHFKPVSLSC
jgi:hypothetical protein